MILFYEMSIKGKSLYIVDQWLFGAGVGVRGGEDAMRFPDFTPSICSQAPETPRNIVQGSRSQKGSWRSPCATLLLQSWKPEAQSQEGRNNSYGDTCTIKLDL